jgi:hypothetical protein
MEPIIMTWDGEALQEYPGSTLGDKAELTDCVGIHAYCHGWMDARPVSATHHVLVCRSCSLRVVIPREVDTLGKLREHFKTMQPTKLSDEDVKKLMTGEPLSEEGMTELMKNART